MLRDREWHEVYWAIRRAAQFEGKVWKTDSDFMYHYKITRYSLGGEWRQFNISEALRMEMPDDGPIQLEILRMNEELMQPIIDLPWEDYLYPPDKITPFDLMKMGVISVNEFRASEGLERIMDAGISGASGEGQTPAGAG